MKLVQRLLCIIMAMLVLTAVPMSCALGEEDVFIAPTLPDDAPKYDPEHPENLGEDQLYAKSVVLMEANSGKIIFEKNPDAIMFPASTTKILTTMLGIKNGDLSAKVVATATALDVPADGSSMDLRLDEEINFTDLLYGTMLCSANEGANLIAETVSGSIGEFVGLMNDTARELGCTNTHFVNPHGYHDENHYTTARDLALIAREAMKNALFRKIVSTVNYTLPRSNIQRSRTLTTSNRLLRPSTEEYNNSYYYAEAAGIKTGYHSKAGYCFVGYAERDGVELISVILYSDIYGRWTDTKKLMEYGFSQYVSITPIDLYNKNPITIETKGYSLEDSNIGKLPLTCVVAQSGTNASMIVKEDEVDSLSRNLRDTMLIEYTRDFSAPIEAGEIMGKMTYITPENKAVVYNLIASRSIAQRENIPKTIEQIVAETYADPNPFPPFTAEMAFYLFSPFVLLIIVIRILRKLLRRRREHLARVPKPGRRYLK